MSPFHATGIRRVAADSAVIGILKQVRPPLEVTPINTLIPPGAVPIIKWHNALFVVALFIYGVIGARNYDAFIPLHMVDLPLHEIGHPIFGLLGNETLMVMGGSLFQLVFPIAFTVNFAMRRQYYSAAAVLFWVGQNFFDISAYMKDARALKFELMSIGGGEGDEVIHDWNYLFSKWHVLAHDIAIGNVVAAIGWLCLLAMLLGGLWFSIEWVVPEVKPHFIGKVENYLDKGAP